MSSTKNLFINGEWLAGAGVAMESIDPAKNQVVWHGQAATAEQVDAAMTAARQAFPAWAALDFSERLAIVKRFAELLDENKEHLAHVMADRRR